MEKRQKITFSKLPQNVEELKTLKESNLENPFEVCALVVAVLCRYEKSVDDCINMLNFLKGPQPMSEYDKQFLRDRLKGKYYKPFSYFQGTSPENNYTPKEFSIEVFDNPYSYQSEGYVTLWMKSSGADSPRQLKLRQKGNQWFLWENFLLSDIRIPKADDPWA